MLAGGWWARLRPFWDLQNKLKATSSRSWGRWVASQVECGGYPYWTAPSMTNAPTAPEWDKVTCLLLEGLGQLKSSALANAQLHSDYPCTPSCSHGREVKVVVLESHLIPVGPQLPKSVVLFQLQKSVMSWPLDTGSCSHIVLLFSWWVCRHSAWLCRAPVLTGQLTESWQGMSGRWTSVFPWCSLRKELMLG